MRKFCYLTPNFPENAIAAFLLLEERDAKLGFVPSSLIYTSLEETAHSIGEISSALEKARNIKVRQISFIINISLDRKFPLKKDYWARPTLRYGIEEKINTFAKIL